MVCNSPLTCHEFIKNRATVSTYEIESTVQATVQARYIDVVGEFPVQKLEHAIPRTGNSEC